MTKEPAPEGKTNRAVNLSSAEGYDSLPSYSPNGKIAFTGKRDGDYDLYLMRAAPQGRLNKPVDLSRNPADDTSPTWSPDRRVAFNSDRPGSDDTTDLDIWRMRATDGANPTNLTDNAVVDFDPEWKPVP